MSSQTIQNESGRPHRESEQAQSPSNVMAESIPSYAEATTLLPTHLSPPPALHTVEPDAPPAYALLDSTITTFSIHGTFIHTPHGPAYQLSSPLDQRGAFFRLRRLRAKEAQQASSTPIAFDKTYILYEANDPPLLDNEYHIQGKRRSCLPGMLEMKFRLHKWRVTHIPRPGAKPREILTCKKVGAFGSTKLNRRRDVEGSEWKDGEGRVLATEKLDVVRDGGVVPRVELSAELDQQWRELLLMLWTTRLWVAFGSEKTAVLGGRTSRSGGEAFVGNLFGTGGARFR